MGSLKSRTWLSDFTFTFQFHALEKEMATHSRVLAWRIPGTGEPGGLPSMGSHRVGHDWSGLVAAAGVVRNPLANAGDERDMGLIPGLGRSPGGGHGNPLQYSRLENPMDRGAWQVTVHGIAKSQTQLQLLSTHCSTTTTGDNENSNSWCFRALSEAWCQVLYIYIDPYYCIKVSATMIPVSRMRKPSRCQVSYWWSWSGMWLSLEPGLSASWVCALLCLNKIIHTTYLALCLAQGKNYNCGNRFHFQFFFKN